MEARVRYARTEDGASIAFTSVGEGEPLFFARRFLAPGIDDEVAEPLSVWPGLESGRSVVL